MDSRPRDVRAPDGTGGRPSGAGRAPGVAGTSIHVVDRSSLALVPRPARIYQLGTPETVIALSLEAGHPPAAVAERVAAASGAGLARAESRVAAVARLLWPDEAAAAEAAGASDAPGAFLRWREAPRHAGAAADAATIGVRRYRLLDRHVVCRFTDAASLASAGEGFAHLETPGSGPAAAEFVAGAEHGRLRLRRGRAVLDEAVAPAPDMLVNVLRLAFAEAVLAASGDEWAVHAAAVARGPRAVLLPGPAGRGKSTLALGLGAAGFAVLGDDTVVLAAGTLEVRAVPFPLCVKRGSWALAERLAGPPGPFAGGRRMDGLPVRWLPRSAGLDLARPDARAAVACVVFPSFEEGAAPRTRRLDCDDTLRRLVPGLHALGEGLTPAKVDRLVAWARARPGFEVVYGRLEDAVAAVEGLAS